LQELNIGKTNQQVFYIQGKHHVLTILQKHTFMYTTFNQNYLNGGYNFVIFAYSFNI